VILQTRSKAAAIEVSLVTLEWKRLETRLQTRLAWWRLWTTENVRRIAPASVLHLSQSVVARIAAKKKRSVFVDALPHFGREEASS